MIRFKKKKIFLSDVLENLEDKIKTNYLSCRFYHDKYGEIFPETSPVLELGEEIRVAEFYVIDNVLHRNDFTHKI